MKNIKYIALALTMLLITSCEDVVNVDLDTANPRLVIDASIDWIKGTDGSQQTIKLSKTKGYYDTVTPVVSGAVVYITSNGTTFNFIETPNTGKYICSNFVPIINQNYVLTVIVDGQTYTATENLKEVPELEDTVEQSISSGIDGNEIKLKFYFQDNDSQDNFYMSRVDCSILPYPEYDVFSDEFRQGNLMFREFDDDKLVVNNTVKFNLYGISERYSNYLEVLLNAADSGGVFQTTPSNAVGNIVNQSDENNFALGYFRLSEVDSKIYIIQ